MTKTLAIACQLCYDWQNGNGNQSTFLNYCDNNNLKSAPIEDFVYSHTDEYMCSSNTWAEFNYTEN